LFAFLLVLQWLVAIALALWIAPRGWEGGVSQTHLDVWIVLLLGGAIVSFPIYLAIRHPDRRISRHAVGFSQALMGCLLIHLTGGRSETHFQVFCSLALLAFYRDGGVLATASAVVVVDHVVRGIWFPESVFGEAGVSSAHILEHIFWVVVEDIFLIIACRQNRREMWTLALRQAELAVSHTQIENLVAALPQMVWTTTPEGNCDYVNARWIDYTGLSGPDSLGSGWKKALHPEDWEHRT
jgi:PAS domain-containing protein